MKLISNRQAELRKLFAALQQCVATGIDPNKDTFSADSATLNVDAKMMKRVSKEVGKLLGCVEGAPFTAQELQQLLLQTAAQNIETSRAAPENAAAATTDFIALLGRRVRRYLVPFVTPGLRFSGLPPSLTPFRIGVCEFSSDPKRLREIFGAIKVPIRFRVRQRHAFPKGEALVFPKGETIAVSEVTTSTRFATVEAQARLEEAYGYFVLYYDAVSAHGPSGPATRRPLISWQHRPALAPMCRVAAEPTTVVSRHRFGQGFDQLWHKGYDVDLVAAEPELRALGFFEHERELFDTDAKTEMAGRIRTALRWLTRALQGSENETKFLSFAIALEALFTAPSADYKINALIRDCVAAAASWTDPNEVRKLMGDLYGRRSGIAHQGTIAQFIHEIDELHFIVVQCLGESLNAGDHRRTYEQMLTRFGLNLESYRQDDPAGAAV